MLKLNNSVVRNFLNLSVLKGTDFLIPLIIFPLLVRDLGLEYFGLFSFAIAIGFILAALVQYGFNVTVSRDISRGGCLQTIYNDTIYSSFFMLFVSFIIFLLLVLLVEKIHKDFYFFLMMFFYSALTSLFPMWLYHGVEKFFIAVSINLVVKIFLLVSILVLIESPDDYLLVSELYALSALMAILLSLLANKRIFKLNIQKPNVGNIKTLLIRDLDSFLTQFFPNLYNSFAVFVLGVSSTNTNVGIYAAASKIVEALISVGTIVSNAFLPSISKDSSRHTSFSQLMLGLASALCIIVYAFSSDITVILYGNLEVDVYQYIDLMLLGVFAIFMNRAFGINYLMLMGHEKVVKNNVMYVSFISAFMAIIFIPVYGIMGVVVVVTISRIVIGCLSYYFYYRLKRG